MRIIGAAAAGITVAVAMSVMPAGTLAGDEPLSGKRPYINRQAWDGLYAGVQGGYSWGSVEADALWGPGGAAESFSYTPEGAMGGVHLGLNKRFANVVLGLEADFEFSDLDGSGEGSVNALHQTDIDWMGSLRARIGVTSDQTLLYLTGGLAFAHADTSQTQLVPRSAIPFSAYDDTMTGWTAGAGVEHLITRDVTLRLEYRYTDFGKSTHLDTNMNMQETNRIDTHDIRVGLSLQF